MIDWELEPGSFRDRTARVFYRDGSVFRKLSPQGLKEWELLSASACFRRFVDEGRIVRTRLRADEPLDGDEGWVAVLEHERMPFISYPYEWPFSMLKDAALLQLDLLTAALQEGIILKDSTPFNIQWRGASPVFIDITSFERLRDGEPWAGYRQFCQLFLYPLMLQAYKGVGYHSWLRGNLEGIESVECRRLFSLRDLLRPGVLLHVLLHSQFQSSYKSTARNVRNDLRSAGFSSQLIKNNVRRLRRTVEKLTWEQKKSEWSDYAKVNSYEAADAQAKRDFVREAIGARHRSMVWDLGCNTGDFSRMAAEKADCVVAFDLDHLAVERLYRALKAEQNTQILPLVNNLAAPSPALGWRGTERRSLEQRGRPDLILCLALIHHMVISANVPMADFVDWIASLGGDLVIEYVKREDPMVQTLLRNKSEPYADYDQKNFENLLGARFRSVRSEPLTSGTRVLYFARRES